MKEPSDISHTGNHWQQQVYFLIILAVTGFIFSKQIPDILSGLSSAPDPNRHQFSIALTVFEPIKHYLINNHINEVGFLTQQSCDALCQASSQFLFAPILLHIDQANYSYVIAPTQQATQLLAEKHLEAKINVGDYTLYSHNNLP